jgi:hypothetical protein
MNHGFRKTLGRALHLLTVFALLAVAVPGCGDAPKKDAGASVSGIPENVQESNNNMMKTKKAATKK